MDEDNDLFSVSIDQFTELSEKVKPIGRTISDSQIKTQNQVASFTGIDRLGVFDWVSNTKMDSREVRGKQLFVPMDIRSIKVTGDTRNSYVISEIDHVTVFRFESPITHLVITHCYGIVIVIKGTPLTGIECISSQDVVIECDSYNFVRTTTSDSCRLTGKCDVDTLFDIRNCNDVYVNGERIKGNVFTESRFKMNDSYLEKVEASEDIFIGPSSLPNTSIMKLW